jgi:glycosyltransferase involved in cell wall biosynthesis
MPVRNEKAYIRESLESLLDQDFPTESVQIICVDGMSEDGTRDILRDYAKLHGRLVVVDNPKRTTACALNLGIKHSKGDFIIRVDAHSKYPYNYISKLVENMEKLPAENVGGVCEIGSLKKSLQGDAIRVVLTSRLGVGNSLFRVGVDRTVEADTVPFGCYRRSLFDRIGFYDERLYRTEDYEFNQRIRKAGGKIFLIPDIRITYFPPVKLRIFFRKQFNNGYGIVESGLVYGKLSFFSIRHYTPLFFVLYLLCLPLLIFVHWAFLLPLLSYALLNAIVALGQARKQRKFSPIFMVPLALIGTHGSHGLGALFSLVEAPFRRMSHGAQVSPVADSGASKS